MSHTPRAPSTVELAMRQSSGSGQSGSSGVLPSTTISAKPCKAIRFAYKDVPKKFVRGEGEASVRPRGGSRGMH